MNLLLEAYLDEWSAKKETDIVTKEKLLVLLSKAPDCPTWDWARALFACKMVCLFTNVGIFYEVFSIHGCD